MHLKLLNYVSSLTVASDVDFDSQSQSNASMLIF